MDIDKIILEIPVCNDAVLIEIVDGGYSQDQKIRVQTQNGTQYFVRLASDGALKQCQQEYDFLMRCASLNLPIPTPIDFGTVCGYVYRVYLWIEGEDLEVVLPHLSKAEQLQYGIDAGVILKRLHSVECGVETEAWETYYNRKIDSKLELYQRCPLKYPKDQVMLDEIGHLRKNLKGRPVCVQHGDYHSGNMIYGQNGVLSIIDFNRTSMGDPWEEFNRIIWDVKHSSEFARGIIHGYFGMEPPRVFFSLMKLYVYVNTLASLPWALPFGAVQIEIMQENYQHVMSWYERTSVIPKWY